MCGRFTIRKPVTKTVDIVKTHIKVEDNDNYNAHPTQHLPPQVVWKKSFLQFLRDESTAVNFLL